MRRGMSGLAPSPKSQPAVHVVHGTHDGSDEGGRVVGVAELDEESKGGTVGGGSVSVSVSVSVCASQRGAE
jgi:hypothetical protein